MRETNASQPANPGSGVASEVVAKSIPENRPTLATELLRAETGDVQADTVTMERAGAEQVTAQRAILTNSGARTIDARSAQIDRSGILALNCEKAVFYNSSAVVVAAGHARIVRGRVFALKADTATIEGDARIGIYAGPASEHVRPVLDAGGAAAFGAAFGAVFLVLGSLLRRLRR
ncbi:MAG: hypothetical protein K0Q71_2051 [Thermomicrobiales bacterium]|nr:hypothetical protein [Thermomicrobiales bacterium]